MSDNTGQVENRFARAKRIALEVVEEARVQLMMKFRFLDVALWKMELRPTAVMGRYALATDGAAVYFEPYTVIGRFDAGFDEVVRDYLHAVMHCLFRHPYERGRMNTDAWWLACDVMAESAAMELCGERFASPLDVERHAALDELLRLCGGKMTLANLYGLFVRSQRAGADELDGAVSGARLNEYKALFQRDSHVGWPAYDGASPRGEVDDLADPKEDSEDKRESDGRDMVADGESTEFDEDKQDIWDPTAARETDDPDADYSQDSEDESEGSSEDADDAGENSDETDNAAEGEGDSEGHKDESEEERTWEEIAKQVEMDLQTFSQDWGFEAGGFIKSLAIANRKKYDYADFLRRFAALSEEMKINDDEFDYVYYTYGLKLYGNLPLIEPLEYKETQRVRDFAICIDTSESCKGELVRKFVEHTFNIMKKQEDYAHAINVHVIQCDAKVQADMKINDLRDVDRFMEGFEVRGLGGTDFRPAFAYVNALVDSGELPDMKGMIYFTDGLGQFPEKPPDYDAAFVFMDEGQADLPAVPPWAMRVVIDEEGIDRLKSDY